MANFAREIAHWPSRLSRKITKGIQTMAAEERVLCFKRQLFGRCKTTSVNCLSSIRHHPSGVRRSEGERSEPSAAEPRRGDDALRAKNWSRAGHTGFLLGCQQTHPTIKPHGPPHRS